MTQCEIPGSSVTNPLSSETNVNRLVTVKACENMLIEAIDKGQTRIS